MGSQKFHKDERLRSGKSIALLFREGKSIHNYPVRVIYRRAGGAERSPSVKVAFAVPRKSFKRSVVRNRIKRRMREAYRLNKSRLIDKCSHPIDVVFLYSGREELSYQVMERSIKKLLDHLLNTYK